MKNEVTLLNEITNTVVAAIEKDGRVFKDNSAVIGKEYVKLVPLTVAELFAKPRTVLDRRSGREVKLVLDQTHIRTAVTTDHLGIVRISQKQTQYRLVEPVTGCVHNIVEDCFYDNYLPVPKKGEHGRNGHTFIEDLSKTPVFKQGTVIVKKVELENQMTTYYYKVGDDLQVATKPIVTLDDPWTLGKTYVSKCNQRFKLIEKGGFLKFSGRDGETFCTGLTGVLYTSHSHLQILPEEYKEVEVPGWGVYEGRLVELLETLETGLVRYTDGKVVEDCNIEDFSKIKTLNGREVKKGELVNIAVTADGNQLFLANGTWRTVESLA